jgi:hypothetical protein
MQKNEKLKQNNIYSKILFSTIVLFFIGALVGCSKSVSVDTEEVTAKVAGKVQDDSELTGISVRLLRLGTSGNAETVSLRDVFTNSEGKFILETNLDGESNLLVHAVNNGREWRGILSAAVKPGIAVYSQPLNIVTTVSADLFTKALESGSNIEYTQIRLFIDEEIAGILDSNRELMNNVVSAISTEFYAEKETMLRTEIGGTTSEWQQIIVAKTAAQAAFDRDLYYALSASTQQAALYNYLCSISDAYVDVGLQSETFSKVLEASVRTFLKEIEGINSRLEFKFSRRTSGIRARALNASILSEFQKLGADPSMINKVIYAGETLQENVERIQSAEGIANEFSDYRDQILENLLKVLGVYGDTIQACQANIDDYKTALISDVANSSDADGIITAYINFYSKVKNLVIQHLDSETVQQNAAAEVLILLNMYF